MHRRCRGESFVDYLDRIDEEVLNQAKIRRQQFTEIKPEISQPARYVTPILPVTIHRAHIWKIFRMMTQQNNRCYWCCLLLTDQSFHIDHVYPRIRGGSDDISNLRISCVSCNLSKSDTLPQDFALSLLSL